MPIAECLLSLDPVLGRDLTGVLGREQPGQARRPFGVKAGEVPVWRRADEILAAQMQRLGAHRVGRRRTAIAAPPAQGVAHELHAPWLAAALDHGQQMPPQCLDNREQERLSVLGAQIPIYRPRPSGAQVASDAGTGTQAHPHRPVARIGRRTRQQRDLAQPEPLALVEGPGLAQTLGDAMAERAGPLLGQRGHVEDQDPAQMIGDRSQHGLAPLRRRLGQNGGARPKAVGGGQLGKPVIADAQQAALLKVRLGNPPGPGKILERPVFEQVDHRPPGVLVAGAATDRLLHEQLGVEIERPKDSAAQLVEAQLSLGVERPNQGAAQQHDLDKVVHVSGLEGRVLTVVGEA